MLPINSISLNLSILSLLFIVSFFFIIPSFICILITSICTINISNVPSTHEIHKNRINKELISSSDVMYFPLCGSFSLIFLYLCIKFFNEYYLKLAINLYIFIFGSITISAIANNFFKIFLPNKLEKYVYATIKSFDINFNHRLLKFLNKNKISISCGSIACYLFSLFISITYLYTKNLQINNFIGIIFCIHILMILDIGSFKNAFLLMSSLFVYDIFWVFGTDVMVTVASKIDAPIKLIFQNMGSEKLSMIGLGDIVIPGVLIILMRKFDENQDIDSKFSVITLLGYFLGLCITLLVNYLFNQPQPALLYLVPCCLILPMVLAFNKGKLRELVKFKLDTIKVDKKD